jgi:hypothetical protein
MFQETAVKIPFYEFYFANGTEKQSTSSLIIKKYVRPTSRRTHTLRKIKDTNIRQKSTKYLNYAGSPNIRTFRTLTTIRLAKSNISMNRITLPGRRNSQLRRCTLASRCLDATHSPLRRRQKTLCRTSQLVRMGAFLPPHNGRKPSLIHSSRRIECSII